MNQSTIMDLVPYYIHPQIFAVTELFKLDLFNVEKYVFDDFEKNQEYLQTLEPRDWKQQDHYAVLRLKKIRFDASQELIKQAYRMQLLNHHPDKGRKRLKKCGDDNIDYFSCITKAFEILNDKSSRNSYDSADPEFDDYIPTQREAKQTFYKSFGPVFQRNARWSIIQPVPMLGDDNSNIDEVFRFYNFWNDFRSWREFSYLDETSESVNDNRDQRRHIDKQNKSERKKKLNEECKRINTLVDLANNNDPRIIKYNAQRKADKEAEKKAKADRKLEIKLVEEKLIKDEKERLEREEAERLQKIKNESTNNKKQKEAMKSKHKNEKRKLRKLAESCNYFVAVMSKVNINKSIELRKLEMANIVDVLCLKMSVEDLTALNEALSKATEEEQVALIKSTDEKVMGKESVICIN